MATASASHLAVGKSLLAAYDVLSARRPAHEEVEAALNSLQELVVASALAGKERTGDDKTFVKLQSKPEWNATAVLLHWLGKACDPILAASRAPEQSVLEQSKLNVIAKALTVLQGLLHLHAGSSRGFYARRPNMEMLLSLLSAVLDGPALDVLALPLLSLLLPAFLDSPYNTRLFESLGGLEMLVKAMKNRQARKEVRMAVVEVVWGWWMGEGGEGEMPGSEDKGAPIEARPRSSLAFPASTSAMDLDQLRRRRGSSDDSAGSRTSQGSPRTTTSSRGSAKAVRKTVVVRPPEPEAVTPSAPLMVQTPSRSRTMGLLPRSSTPVDRKDPRDVPLPETPAASRHLWAEPSPSSMPARRPSFDAADPAVRLRAMLESTAKAFVPTTPHGARSAKKRVGGPDIGWGTPTNETAQAPPKLLFPSPSQAPSPSPSPVPTAAPSPANRGESTPQRILRHKKSASLGSLHFASRAQAPPASSSSGGIAPSPSAPRLAASAAPLSRHHRSIASSQDVRSSPVLTSSPSSTSLLPQRSHRRPNHHRPSLSADTAAAIPRSATSRLALAAVLANDSSTTLVAGDENSPARGGGGTPMRSAAGKALAASLVDDQTTLLPPSTTLRDLANVVSTPSPSPAAVGEPARSKSKKRRSVHLGPVIVEEPAHEPAAVDEDRSRRAQHVKKGKLGRHMSNVDQLVRRFREMGDGLQL